MTTENPKNKGTDFATIVGAWWTSRLRKELAAKSALRRCRVTDDAFYIPLFHELLSRVRAAEIPVNADQLALVACLLSHVKSPHTEDNTSLGRILAKLLTNSPSGQIRFRHLLAVPSIRRDVNARTRLLTEGRRVVALLGGRVPLEDFIDTFYWWDDRRKKTLAMSFYQFS